MHLHKNNENGNCGPFDALSDSKSKLLYANLFLHKNNRMTRWKEKEERAKMRERVFIKWQFICMMKSGWNASEIHL